MRNIDFIIPRADHIEHIARNIRKNDMAELIAAGQHDAHEAIISSTVKSSACVVACDGNTPLIIYGMIPKNLLTGTATIWMLGTEESLKYRRELMRYTRMVLDEMNKEYKTLTNYIHSKNSVSMRWLKALGFSFHSPVTAHSGELFYKFHRSS